MPIWAALLLLPQCGAAPGSTTTAFNLIFNCAQHPVCTSQGFLSHLCQMLKSTGLMSFLMMLHNITPPVLTLSLLACEITGKQGKESSKCSCRGIQWPKLQAGFSSSERKYLKIEVLKKNNVMHWKLTIRGNHCWWSDTARVLVHPWLSQGHHTSDAFSWPSGWRCSPYASLYRARQTLQVRCSCLGSLTAENGCHLDDLWAVHKVWAAPVGTQHLRV